jgi:hypothetical protein
MYTQIGRLSASSMYHGKVSSSSSLAIVDAVQTLPRFERAADVIPELDAQRLQPGASSSLPGAATEALVSSRGCACCFLFKTVALRS